jgi:ATP-dependent exoDNAse (exonuclease V) beta subunit
MFYVGLTRAKRRLVLSTARHGSGQHLNLSRYLRERLGVDFDAIDNKPRDRTVSGVEYRLLVTNQAPAKRPVALTTTEGDGVQAVPYASPGDQSDSAAAVTSIALFAECPRRYYLSRYLGFESSRPARRAMASEEPADAEDDVKNATEFGRQVHDLLAGVVPADAVASRAAELARRFQISELGQCAAAAVAVRREQGILFAVDGHVLRAQTDLWFDDGRRQVLVDYKTDRIADSEVSERTRIYAVQLRLYALAVEQAVGRRPDRAVLYFLEPDSAADVALDEESLRQAQETVREFFTAQSGVHFPLQTGPHCFHCPHFRGLCPVKAGDITGSQDGRAERAQTTG